MLINWNAPKLTALALSSLQSGDRVPDRIIVVDNGSVDDSVAKLQEIEPKVDLIVNDDNRGFAAAANQGMARAFADGADAVFLLNNDAVVEARALSELLSARARHPRGGLFSALIFEDGEGQRVWCAGVRIGFFPNLQDLRGGGEPLREEHQIEEAVPALTGCALLVTRALWDAIGGFDESFFVYVEDVDYSVRATNAGFEAIHVPSAVVRHRASSSSGGGYSAWRKEMLAYNVVGFCRKHGRFRWWAALIVIDILGWPLALVLGILKGRTRAVLAKGRGLLRGLGGLGAPPPPNPRLESDP